MATINYIDEFISLHDVFKRDEFTKKAIISDSRKQKSGTIVAKEIKAISADSLIINCANCAHELIIKYMETSSAVSEGIDMNSFYMDKDFEKYDYKIIESSDTNKSHLKLSVLLPNLSSPSPFTFNIDIIDLIDTKYSQAILTIYTYIYDIYKSMLATKYTRYTYDVITFCYSMHTLLNKRLSEVELFKELVLMLLYITYINDKSAKSENDKITILNNTDRIFYPNLKDSKEVFKVGDNNQIHASISDNNKKSIITRYSSYLSTLSISPVPDYLYQYNLYTSSIYILSLFINDKYDVDIINYIIDITDTLYNGILLNETTKSLSPVDLPLLETVIRNLKYKVELVDWYNYAEVIDDANNDITRIRTDVITYERTQDDYNTRTDTFDAFIKQLTKGTARIFTLDPDPLLKFVIDLQTDINLYILFDKIKGFDCIISSIQLYTKTYYVINTFNDSMSELYPLIIKCADNIICKDLIDSIEDVFDIYKNTAAFIKRYKPKNNDVITKTSFWYNIAIRGINNNWTPSSYLSAYIYKNYEHNIEERGDWIKYKDDKYDREIEEFPDNVPYYNGDEIIQGIKYGHLPIIKSISDKNNFNMNYIKQYYSATENNDSFYEAVFAYFKSITITGADENDGNALLNNTLLSKSELYSNLRNILADELRINTYFSTGLNFIEALFEDIRLEEKPEFIEFISKHSKYIYYGDVPVLKYLYQTMTDIHKYGYKYTYEDLINSTPPEIHLYYFLAETFFRLKNEQEYASFANCIILLYQHYIKHDKVAYVSIEPQLLANRYNLCIPIYEYIADLSGISDDIKITRIYLPKERSDNMIILSLLREDTDHKLFSTIISKNYLPMFKNTCISERRKLKESGIDNILENIYLLDKILVSLTTETPIYKIYNKFIQETHIKPYVLNVIKDIGRSNINSYIGMNERFKMLNKVLKLLKIIYILFEENAASIEGAYKIIISYLISSYDDYSISTMSKIKKILCFMIIASDKNEYTLDELQKNSIFELVSINFGIDNTLYDNKFDSNILYPIPDTYVPKINYTKTGDIASISDELLFSKYDQFKELLDITFDKDEIDGNFRAVIENYFITNYEIVANSDYVNDFKLNLNELKIQISTEKAIQAILKHDPEEDWFYTKLLNGGGGDSQETDNDYIVHLATYYIIYEILKRNSLYFSGDIDSIISNYKTIRSLIYDEQDDTATVEMLSEKYMKIYLAAL